MPAGGLYINGGTTGLYNVTVAKNQANSDTAGIDTGGGIFNGGGTVTFANSIISANTYLVIKGMLAHCTVSGSYSTLGASLGPLQDNGGPTLTHALLAGSAAIDAGNPSGCTDNFGAMLTTDQRGARRPSGAACDIGAFELDDTMFQNGFDL